MESLVSTGWLAEELGAPDLKVIDATIFLPGAGRDARAEYEAEHIPGAVFMDLDEIVDASNAAPHMLPPAHKFSSRMQPLGLGDGHRFVAYDNTQLQRSDTASRMRRVLRAHYCALLVGCLLLCMAQGRRLDMGETKVRHIDP